MENRSYALMTGVFTIALVIAAVLAGLWFNRDRTELVPYEIVTTQSIPGLNPQATVRYRGLEIGRVDEIVFDPRVTGQIGAFTVWGVIIPVALIAALPMF